MYTKKLKSGSWCVEAYAGYDRETKKQYRKSFTGKDLRALKMLAAEWEQTHRSYSDSASIRSAVDSYMWTHARQLSPSTQSGYASIARNLPDWLTRIRCDHLTPAQLQRLVNESTLSPKSIRNQVAFLSTVLRSQGLRLPMVTLPQVAEPPLNIPDTDVVRETIRLAREQSTELWIVIMLAATAPLRAGEISALTLDDISGDTIHVCHDMVYGTDHKWYLKPPKTKSSDRYIDMPHELIEAIRAQGFVTHWRPKRIYDIFQRFLRRNRLPIYRFHDLRHFCISFLLSQGIDEVSVAERSGHADHASMKRYVHALGLHRRSVSEKILSLYESF